MRRHRFTFLTTLLLLFTILWTQKSFSQVAAPVENQSAGKSWLEMIQDPNVNFYEAKSAFNKYWANRTDHKGNGYKVFKRWEYINEARVLPDGKLQAPEYVMNEFNKYMSKFDGPSSASGNWTIQGPTQYVINNTSQPTGMGRVNAIAFHPTDVNTIYIGAPSGGIWKTTNGGGSWENLANNLPKLGVSSILIHPVDPNIIYIGTGDRDGGDAPGIGVFKTINGGITWNQINNTMGDVTVGDMLMHPSDPNTILVATNVGIYKTTNGGATWALKSGAYNFKDIQFKPGDPTVVYAVRITTPSRFYRSTNTGDSWTQITSGLPTTGIGSRMVIGTSPANPNCVYLVQIKLADGTFANLLRSNDAGLSFTSMSTSPNIMGYNCDGSGTASQATYDLCINVDPTNANIVFVGGINTWKSIDGGATWNSSTNWNSTCGGTGTAVHADHHVLEWNPLNGGLYLGHDGGITYTANGGTSWTEITGGLPISQVYKLGQGASNSNYTVMGLQDNGIGATINGSTFYTVNGGDGGECIIDYANSNYCYDTYVEGPIRRSTTGPLGSYSTIAANGTNGIDETAAWIIPYFLHKTDHLTMFAGYNNLWRSNNVTSSPPTWTKISTGETSVCKVLEQSAADLGVVYVVRSGSLKRTDNANDAAASVTWAACTLPDGLTPTYLATHPTNANIVYATAGNSVYKSTDKGLTWTTMDPNISLPALSINCLVYDKNSNEGIYVGNQTGVWYKNATMTDWMLFSNGLPPVDVRELEIFYDPIGTQNRLKAATYGRGLWQSDLYESGVLNPANFTTEVSSNTQIDLSWSLTSGNNVLLAFNTSPTFGNPVNGNSYATSLPGGGIVLYSGSNTSFNHTSLVPNTTYYYKIWSYDGAMNYSAGSTANETTTYSLANFNADIAVSCTGSLTVNFTDASLGAYNSWAWDIDNNGTTDYTTQNPAHTYASPGLYTVKLAVNNGASEIIKENLVLVMNTEPTTNTGCTLTSNSNNGNAYGIEYPVCIRCH
ncbi:MAG: PKD domain-containing protein [Bacteroidales bacterium]|nr:PKD domain-containing protein [Bacteroidales bacterium]